MSIVSVSLFAGLPHFGQVTFTQSSSLARGEGPRPENSTCSGNSTGNCSVGTGTVPQSWQ